MQICNLTSTKLAFCVAVSKARPPWFLKNATDLRPVSRTERCVCVSVNFRESGQAERHPRTEGQNHVPKPRLQLQTTTVTTRKQRADTLTLSWPRIFKKIQLSYVTFVYLSTLKSIHDVPGCTVIITKKFATYSFGSSNDIRALTKDYGRFSNMALLQRFPHV